MRQLRADEYIDNKTGKIKRKKSQVIEEYVETDEKINKMKNPSPGVISQILVNPNRPNLFDSMPERNYHQNDTVNFDNKVTNKKNAKS